MNSTDYGRLRKNAQNRASYARNIEKCRAKSLAYYYAHREEVLAKHRAKWREKHPTKTDPKETNA